MTDDGDNPFSFKNFVKDSSQDLTITKTHVDISEKEDESQESGPQENPFSFKTFVGGVSKSKNFSETETSYSSEPVLDLPLFDEKSQDTLIDSEAMPDRILGMEEFGGLSPLPLDSSIVGDDFTDNEGCQFTNTNFDEFDETLLLPVKVSVNNELLPAKQPSKSDDLKKELDQARQLIDNQAQRISHLESELSLLRKKEKEETSALEDVIHKVEQNLKLSTQRAVKAEQSNADLKQKLQHLHTEVQHLQTENTVLRNQLEANNYGETMKYVSEQLKLAANGAKVSLNQLLDGVSHLKHLSDILIAADVTEVKSDSCQEET